MATVKPSEDGKAWVMDWRENGKRYQRQIGKKRFMSEREAKLILKAKELELATGQRVSATTARAHRFSVLAVRYLEWHKREYPSSHCTIRGIINDKLLPAFKDDPAIDAIDSDRIEHYLAAQLQLLKPSTVIKQYNTLRAMYKKANDWGMTSARPLADVRKPEDLNSKPRHFFSRDELHRLYDTPSRWGHVWRLIANTGMRRAEAQHLEWSHIDNGVVNILSTGMARTKSAKWRAVPLTSGARRALVALRMDSDSKFVLPQIAGSSLSRAFKADMKRAKIKAGSLHSLRHSFGTHLIMQGKPLRAVQVLMGHSSITVTEGYAHVSPEFRDDMLKGFEL